MTVRFDTDLAPLLSTLERNGDWMRAAELSVEHSIDARVLGQVLMRAAAEGRIEAEPKTGQKAARYRALHRSGARSQWFRGWTDPHTGITPERLG